MSVTGTQSKVKNRLNILYHATPVIARIVNTISAFTETVLLDIMCLRSGENMHVNM